MSDEIVVCRKAHVHPSFGEVPAGSRWHADDPVVEANPKHFAKERAA